MPRQSNPFLVALVSIGVIAGAVAVILSIVSAQAARNPFEGDPLVAVGTAAWAAILGQIAVLAIIGALVAGAITWRPSGKPPSPSALGGDGLTPGERRFFTEEDGL